MKPVIIVSKTGKLRLRKATKEQIQIIKSKLGIKNEFIFPRYLSKEAQEEIVTKWKNYIYENTNFNFASFHTEIQEVKPNSFLFGTILFRRENEIMKKLKFYKQQKLKLSKIKKQYENILTSISNLIIEKAVINSYPDELLLNCLKLVDDLIVILNDETEPILKEYDSRIDSCKLEISRIENFKAEGKYQMLVSNSEYLKARTIFEEVNKIWNQLKNI